MVVSVTDTYVAERPFFIFCASWASFSLRSLRIDSPKGWLILVKMRAVLGRERIIIAITKLYLVKSFFVAHIDNGKALTFK